MFKVIEFYFVVRRFLIKFGVLVGVGFTIV